MNASDRPGPVVYVLVCSPVDDEALRATHLAVADAFDQLIDHGIPAMTMSAHLGQAAIAVLTASRQGLS